MKNAILSAKNLNKSFGENAVLRDVNLDVYDGDFTVIMGSSGSGKSTLLYTLSGMDRATSGSVTYENIDVATATEKQLTKLRAECFGFVFQGTYLVGNMSLYENVLISGYASGNDKNKVLKRAEYLFEKMNLVGAKDRLPSSVSGGEAQRAAVARAVISEPEILFADEPTGALNKANTKEVLNLFSSLNEEGQTILMVTHDKSAAIRGNRIIFIEDGRIVNEISLEKYSRGDKKRDEKVSQWLTELGW